MDNKTMNLISKGYKTLVGGITYEMAKWFFTR